ncbi:MAG: DUF4440 domain-containing protein [Bacteroidota bacterium]
MKRNVNVRILFTSLSIALLNLLSCQQNSDLRTFNLTDAEKTKLVELRSTLIPQAYEKQDTTFLNKILHENYLLVDDEGSTFSKVDELAYVGNYGVSYSSFAFELEKTITLPNGTVILFGEGKLQGIDDAGAYITTYKTSDTFVKTSNEDWKLAYSHVSGVKEERFENAPGY